MLLIIGVLFTLAILAAIVPRMWVSANGDKAPIGWMSGQWLAEHRASHPS